MDGATRAIRTTDEIARTIRVHGRGATTTCRWPARSSTRPGIDLPIEPYTFGAWLGDGTTTKAEITSVDPEILEQISGDGFSVQPVGYAPHLYRIGGVGHTRDARTGRYTANGSLSSRLRAMGQIHGKFVPRDVPGGGHRRSGSPCCRA